ncbi:F-box/LRR-repeat protein [Spatholobus suberectus]|nr:F-box/LRR-repeat protein [Spatholobus suberectus]
MDDRISSLPDAVPYHVLSFLPTKVAIATSLLCKRWNHLWRSVPVVDFDDDNYHTNTETYFRFVRSVYAFILSRDMDQPLQRFCLSSSYLCDPVNVKTWLVAATQCRVEHLDFDFSLDCIFDLPTAGLTCKTLVVFKLSNVRLSSLKSCSVDLRRLKILHLNSVTFSEDRDLAELLSGSPNLEDLEVSDLYFESYVVGTKFTRLAKLVRAHIFTPEFPLQVVNNVEFLRINWMDHRCLIPEFRNLTRLKFGSYVKGLLVLDLIKRCPKLQILVIYKICYAKCKTFTEHDNQQQL